MADAVGVGCCREIDGVGRKAVVLTDVVVRVFDVAARIDVVLKVKIFGEVGDLDNLWRYSGVLLENPIDVDGPASDCC